MLYEMLICCHPIHIYQMELREVCFAWLSFFFFFLRLQPLDRFIYFLFSIGKDGKLFSSISFYQTEMVRKQQTNNYLSPVFVINCFLLITNNILVVAYLNCEQFGVLFGSYLRGFFFLCFFQSGIHREIRA